MELTEREEQTFERLTQRDWVMVGNVNCAVRGCFEPVTDRAVWNDHLADDAHFCSSHFTMFLRYYNWQREKKRQGESLPFTAENGDCTFMENGDLR